MQNEHRNALIRWAARTYTDAGTVPSQVGFVRDDLTSLVGTGLDWEARDGIIDVVGEHRSKSVVLPVCRFVRKDLGLTLVLRSNYYDWKLSVLLDHPISSNVRREHMEVVFATLFFMSPPVEPEYTGDVLHPVYFEGFPGQYKFRYYTENPERFSAAIHSNFRLWTAVYMLMYGLGVVEDRRWRTEASHRAELDIERTRYEVRRAADKDAT